MLSLFSQTLSPPAWDNFWYGMVGQRTAAGIDVTPDVAMTYSAVWACTRVLSASGSSLPFNLHRRTGDRSEIAYDHPVQRILHDVPNDDMGSMGFRSLGIARQVNCGGFYAEIMRDQRGAPWKLEPITSDRVKPIRADKASAVQIGLEPGRLSWQVTNDDGTRSYLRDSEMFHVRSIISDNGITGKGVITNARETIAHGLATVQQGAAYMKNSARPSVVISGLRIKNAADLEEYRRMWGDVHGGAANNAKPAFTPEGSEVKVLSFSPEDSQFIQTLQHSVEDIARWYGVPPHMIQHLLRSTFSNIEHQGIDFVVYSLLPWLKMWEEEVYRKLLTPIEQQAYYAKHNVTALLRGDSAARAAYYQALWQLGAYSINEIRELEDMNPIEGGDQHFVQTSYTTIDKLSIGEWEKARTKNDVSRNEFRAKVLQLPPSENTDGAPLLSLVGGLTGSIELARAVGAGEISEEAGAELLQLFLQIEAARATAIAGEKQESDEPPAAMPQRSRIEQEPEEKPEDDGELAAKIAALIEYVKPPESIEPRLAAVQEAARLMVEETAARMLQREITIIERASGKPPKEFFATIDEHWGEHAVKLSQALRVPIQAYRTACGLEYDCDETCSCVTEDQIRRSRDDVLELTTCQPDEWPQLGERFATLASTWRETRAKQVIDFIEHKEFQNERMATS